MQNNLTAKTMGCLLALALLTAPATVALAQADEHVTLEGPYFLRSAYPIEPGEMELKFIFGYERESDDVETYEFEFELEWGFMENWEFIFGMPFEILEGNVDGNGDVGEFGLHTFLREEMDGWPAIGMRNLVSIPTGHNSHGWDYTFRLLLTKTLNDATHLHINPYATAINSNSGHHDRNFVWGVAIGIDYRYSDDMLFIVDYINSLSEEEGVSNQHNIELGLDWDLGEDQMLGFKTAFEVDGDSFGENFSAEVSYIFEIEAPTLHSQSANGRTHN